MKFTTAAAAAAILSPLGSGLVPAVVIFTPSTLFKIDAEEPGAPFGGHSISASRGSLVLDNPSFSGFCPVNPLSRNYVEFFLEGGQLLLYELVAPYQALVDPQSGKLTYGVAGQDQLTREWSVNNAEEVFFQGRPLMACADSDEPGWSIFASGDEFTSGRQNCTVFTAHAKVQQVRLPPYHYETS